MAKDETMTGAPPAAGAKAKAPPGKEADRARGLPEMPEEIVVAPLAPARP